MMTSQIEDQKSKFSPLIIGFYCKWCTHTASDLAGTSRIEIDPEVIGMRVPCSGRVDPTFILQAFSKGADGILIGGCHFGDCHYNSGNYNAFRRIKFLKKMLNEVGIEPERVRIEWISASEAKKFSETIHDFTEEIKNLGPLKWNSHIKDGKLEKTISG